MIGKTIERVEERAAEGLWGTYRMWFTDGTCVDLAPSGYEADDITFTERGPEDFERERVEAEQKAFRDAAEEGRRARRAAEWEVKRAEMEGCLSPRLYEKWLDSERPLRRFEAAMKAEFEGAIKDQLKASRRLLFGAP